MRTQLVVASALAALLAAARARAVEPASAPRPLPAEPRGTVPVPPRAEASRVALDSIVSTDSFLPAVHVNGATGVFRTDVWIFNPDPSSKATVDLYFADADTDGTSAPGLRITPDLEPRESVALLDVVSAYFSRPSGYGLLEIRGSLPVIVTSNTYNVAGAASGTYGQFSPGQALRNALGFDNSIYGDLYVTGLVNDADHRTNVAVLNPTAVPLQAGVQLVDSVGNVYKTVLVAVPPYSMHQLNDIFFQDFASSRPPQGGPWRLNVYVDLGNGAKVLCYATLIDLRTGDPYLIPGQAARP